MAEEWISKNLHRSFEKPPHENGGFFILIISRLQSTHGKEKIIIQKAPQKRELTGG